MSKLAYGRSGTGEVNLVPCADKSHDRKETTKGVGLTVALAYDKPRVVYSVMPREFCPRTSYYMCGIYPVLFFAFGGGPLRRGEVKLWQMPDSQRFGL